MNKHRGPSIKLRVKIKSKWFYTTIQEVFDLDTERLDTVDQATLGVGCDWLSQTVYHGDVVRLAGTGPAAVLWIDGVFFIADLVGMDPITVFDRGEYVEILGDVWQDDYPGKLWIQEYMEDLNK